MKYLVISTLFLLVISCMRSFKSRTIESVAMSENAIIRKNCSPEILMSQQDTLILEFTEYPGRAYSWMLANPESSFQNLNFIGIKRISLGDGDDSAEKVEFHFSGKKKGEEKVFFKYVRPWETNKPSADSCNIKVIVE